MTAFDPRAVAAAKDELFRIPGVHMVGVGLRWVNGRMTDQQALIVHVRRKLPLEQVDPRDRIPREINGIPTDVVESGTPIPLDDAQFAQPDELELPTFDSEEYPQIRGGLHCDGGGTGTIACVARATDVTNNNKLVILSAQHVFASGSGNGVGKSIYQPSLSCCCCGHVVAKVLRSRKTTTGAFFRTEPTKTSVDASIALLLPSLQCLAEIQLDKKPGTGVQVVRAVLPSNQIVHGLGVQKRGARTGSMTGKVDDVQIDKPPAGGSDKEMAFRNQMTITPTFPGNATDGVFRFGAGGDSGSAVMTQAGDQIVGLLWSVFISRPQPSAHPNLVLVKGVATDINAIITQLQISIETAAAAGTVINVPATNVLPAAAPAPSTPAPAHTRSMLEQARQQIEATEAGRLYAEVVRRHHHEVRTLVRTNRRVGAIWKRYGGQAILQAVLNAVGRPDAPIPHAVASRPLADCAARIAGVLRRYGSAALAHDAAAYEHLVAALPGRSYNELIARLRAGAPLGAM
jgi:hypothetical protein